MATAISIACLEWASACCIALRKWTAMQQPGPWCQQYERSLFFSPRSTTIILFAMTLMISLYFIFLLLLLLNVFLSEWPQLHSLSALEVILFLQDLKAAVWLISYTTRGDSFRLLPCLYVYIFTSSVASHYVCHFIACSMVRQIDLDLMPRYLISSWGAWVYISAKRLRKQLLRRDREMCKTRLLEGQKKSHCRALIRFLRLGRFNVKWLKMDEFSTRSRIRMIMVLRSKP